MGQVTPDWLRRFIRERRRLSRNIELRAEETTQINFFLDQLEQAAAEEATRRRACPKVHDSHSDRELIELAAKATELPECGWMGPAFMYVKDNAFTDWNPLNDDADAEHLAAALALEVDIHRTGIAVRTPMGHKILISAKEESNPDVATRRAIVRAAAEIGKNR